MMNIFSSLRVYAGKWAVKGEPRNFTQEEIAAVKQAVVVSSEYGLSVCFFMKSGGQTYIPLSTTSTKGSGETINLATAKLVTLCKEGESDIYRVEA
jgi:hypothetical protein